MNTIKLYLWSAALPIIWLWKKLVGRKRLTLLLCILLIGCVGLGTVKTEIKSGSNDVLYTVKSKSDALVEFEDANKKIKLKVDNKGRQSVWETILGIMVSKPDISIRP